MMMLASGIRFVHVLEALNNWKPNEELYILYLNKDIKRLECPETHCRYYLYKKEDDIKPAVFIFLKRLLTLINQHRDRLPNRRQIEKVVRKWE